MFQINFMLSRVIKIIVKIVAFIHLLIFNRCPDQIIYVKQVPSVSADNSRSNSLIDPHLLNPKSRKSLKSFRNASLDIGSNLHPDGKLQPLGHQ